MSHQYVFTHIGVNVLLNIYLSQVPRSPGTDLSKVPGGLMVSEFDRQSLLCQRKLYIHMLREAVSVRALSVYLQACLSNISAVFLTSLSPTSSWKVHNLVTTNIKGAADSPANQVSAGSVARVKTTEHSMPRSQRSFNDRSRTRVGRKRINRARRVKWAPVLAKAQRMYDKKWMRLKRIARLREKAYAVRRQLHAHGIDQKPLLRGKEALLVEGVIYALWSPFSRKLYVGQTSKSPFHRYMQHYWKSLTKPNRPVSKFFRACGFRNVFVFPLEVISRSYLQHTNPKKRLRHFRQLATERECYWIERLHTYRPRGLNVEFSVRNRQRPHRCFNPFNRLLNPMPHIRVISRSKDQRPSQDIRWYAFRDYRRRCAYLVRRWRNKTLTSVVLSSYKRSVLWRMLAVVRSSNHGFEEEEANATASFLQTFLLLRKRAKVQRSSDVCPLVIEWRTRDIDRLRLRRILESEEVMTAFPGEFPQRLVIAKRLPKTIASTVQNFSQVAMVSSQGGDEALECSCRKLFPAKVGRLDGCVYTGDLSLVRNQSLRKILQYGLNFRTGVLFPNVHDAIADGLSALASRLSKSLAIERSRFEPWIREVLRAAHTLMEAVPANSHGLPMKRTARKYLRFLQKHLVIVPTDKAARNASFICKRLYHRILSKEFSESGAYETQLCSLEDVVRAHTEFLDPKHLFGSDRLGYLYFLPKLHKPVASQRFIASLADCTTTHCSRLLTKALALVLHTLREKDDTNIRITGVRRYFVVDGYEEVADFIHKYRRTSHTMRNLYTGDFSTMYTTIPHDDLLLRIGQCVKEAWEYQAKCDAVDLTSLRIQVTGTGQHDSAKWVRTRSNTAVSFADNCAKLSCDDLMELVTFLVNNIFIMNGGVIRRQVVGLPMGTNCAPKLANLYLYTYESSFIDRVTHVLGLEAARLFHLYCRLIDDVMSLDNPIVQDYINLSAPVNLERRDGEVGGIYPSALVLGETTVSPSEVHFLGMTIRDLRGSLVMDLFDKRSTFPFDVIRYPHMDSNIPSSIPYGVFTGALSRIYRIGSTSKVFVERVRETIATFHQQGCSLPRLMKLLRRFLFKQTPLRWSLPVGRLFNLCSNNWTEMPGPP